MCILFHFFVITNVNILKNNKFMTKWKCKDCRKIILKKIERGNSGYISVLNFLKQMH